MKLTVKHLEIIADKVVAEWKKTSLVQFKVDEKKIHLAILNILKADFQKELDLDKEVHQMLDKLEQSHSGEFQRYKMYPMLKQKLAKDKKVVL